MKKLLLSFVFFVTMSIYSQTSTPFIIEHCIDKMTEKEYYFAQKRMICANPEKTKGFTINPSFDSENGVMINNGFNCLNVGIGNCGEGDSLIFLFEDETKITLKSWNKFNCEGKAYFDLTNEEINALSTKKVSAIRFSNGYTFDNFTYTLKAVEKDYFINLYTNKKIVEVDCSK
jgi:hypothetical protein